MRKKQETPIEKLEGAIEDEAKELKREYRRFERFRDENSLLFGIFVAAQCVHILYSGINVFFRHCVIVL